MNNCAAGTRRRFRVTTVSHPTAIAAANLLHHHFAVSQPDQVWAGDITAIDTREGWLYLAVSLDLCSGTVVGWALQLTLETDLVLGNMNATAQSTVTVALAAISV